MDLDSGHSSLMPDSSTIDLAFADGSYTFALPLVRISELERKCGLPGPPVGIGTIFGRVIKGCVYNEKGDPMLAPGAAEFFAVDLIETIRQGLIGGGKGIVNGEEVKVTPAIAERLMTAYVYGTPLTDSWSMAASILGACVMGYDPPKKD
jgi:hypothetical protein